MDINDRALEEARRKGIITIKADLNIDKIPLPDNYFDAVLMEEVIEHLMNPDHALEEAYRLLRLGGLFVLTTPKYSLVG